MTDDIPGLRRILSECRTVAMVGLSANWYRPSYFAAKYLQEHGFRVIPVTPRYEEVLGEKCYPSLDAIPVPVDVVDCFRRAEEIPAIAEAAGSDRRPGAVDAARHPQREGRRARGRRPASRSCRIAA